MMPHATVYMPQVFGQGIAAQGDADDPAALFAAAWLALLGDRAGEMVHDERLVAAAQWQADWLAANDFDPRDPHLGVDGLTANERVLMRGYQLPEWWPRQGNNVESVTRSWASPEQAALGLVTHAAHTDHMLRRGFFRDHIVWGVGAAEAQLERKGWFYVAITAPVEGD